MLLSVSSEGGARRHVYRATVPGVETLERASLPRHRHARGYATIVLDGSFVEASFAGRFAVRPGDVLLHGPFDCHCNEAASTTGPRILRLPWPSVSVEGHHRARDPDLLARLCERDVADAIEALREMLEPIPQAWRDWPEHLASDLRRVPALALTGWADMHGIARETVSRGFRRAFGVSPKRFRLEARTRMAWCRLTCSERSLTSIAHELEFADLAHMSRSVSELTGFSPSTWRHEKNRDELLDELSGCR